MYWNDTDLLKWLKAQLEWDNVALLAMVPKLKDTEWKKYQLMRISQESRAGFIESQTVRKIERM